MEVVVLLRKNLLVSLKLFGLIHRNYHFDIEINQKAHSKLRKMMHLKCIYFN